MIKVVKLFSYNLNVVPWGYLPLPLSYIHVQKHVIFKCVLWNCLINFHQAFCQIDINLFKWFCIVEQGGCHAPRKLWGWILVYSIGDARSTKFIQIMILGWPLTFYSSVKFLIVAVAILEEYVSWRLQIFNGSCEQIVAHRPLVYDLLHLF